MIGNRIPREDAPFLAMAIQMARGLEALAGELGITGTSGAEVRGLYEACEAAGAAAGVAKAQRFQADRALQAADDAARDFIVQCKQVLACFLGNRWSASWEPTGFPEQSTEIPRRQTQRWNLCASLQLYFQEHPEHENAALGVTGAQAGQHHVALRQARHALNVATADQEAKLQARDAAYDKLKRGLKYCLAALGCVLAPDDSRWLRFGLNVPADPHVPERVEEIKLKQPGPGLIEASWSRAPRATRYRVFVQVVGKDAAPQARPAVYDARTLMTGFAAGELVRIHILAANATGEAAPSPTVEIQLKAAGA